jgi:predicted nucleotidyltransferase
VRRRETVRGGDPKKADKMIAKSTHPTPYPDVNEILNLLRSNVEGILDNQFVGMYLYGSLSSGDFNPETSDIDFLVVTDDTLSDQKIAALESMHKRIWASGMKWASKLEGSYIPQEYIRRHDANNPPCPTVIEGKFSLDRHGSDWIIQRHIVREYGVVLAGPVPSSLIDPVSPDEIRNAILSILNEWWFPMLNDAAWLRQHGSNYHGFAVITMCRARHALEHGTIVSKPVAIQWARENLGEQWHPLIEQAIASQYGEHPEFLNEALDFIRFTRHTVLEFEKSARHISSR